MKNTVARIKDFIDFKGVSVRKFEETTGFSNGAFASQFKNNKTIGVDKVENILHAYPEINPDWLLTGNGQMLKNGDGNISVKESRTQYGQKSIPLLPLEAFAGLGESNIAGVDFDTIEERYDVPLFYNIRVDFMINVRGSSMYPKYSSGDVVACRLVDDLLFVQWNKIYVIDTISQGIIMKRLKKSKTDGNIVCKSDNNEYDEFEVPMNDIRNIALVVGSIRLE